MMDNLELKRRITLGQFTLGLQQRAAEQAVIQADEPHAQLAGQLENAVACQIALGLAKQRTSK